MCTFHSFIVYISSSSLYIVHCTNSMYTFHCIRKYIVQCTSLMYTIFIHFIVYNAFKFILYNTSLLFINVNLNEFYATYIIQYYVYISVYKFNECNVYISSKYS